MILKNKDDQQASIDFLSDLLEREFPEDKKRLIERELKCLYSGNKGENSSAYYLDFEFSRTKNWILIHDLRLELDGDVAQIDHLLIGRMLDCYVIESKNFSYGVSISEEGNFCYFYRNRPYGIPSPIAQNERHIKFLERFFEAHELLPKRLGITIKPSYRNIVLISPNSRLSKPRRGTYDCSSVIKSDKFSERFKNDIDDDSRQLSTVMNLAKVISQQSLQRFAERLVLFHKPISVDYIAKFGLVEPEKCIAEEKAEYIKACPNCGKGMVKRVAKKGKNAGNEFWGCIDYPACKAVVNCQLDSLEVPDVMANVTEPIEQDKASKNISLESPACPRCSGEMLLRTSKRGSNAGEKFWGCKQFPKCRGTMKIDS